MKRIKIIKIGSPENALVSPLDDRDVFDVLVDFHGGDAEFSVECFEDFRQSLHCAAEALKCSEVLIFAVDPALMCETKKLFARAFGLNLVIDKDALEKASAQEEHIYADSKLAAAHAGKAVGSKLISLDDGLYCGFFCRSARQEIFLLPNERDRTLVMLRSGVTDELNSLLDCAISPDFFSSYAAAMLREILLGSDKQIAVAGTNSAIFLREAVEGVFGLEPHFSFAQKAEERHGSDPKEYACNLAVTAGELAGVPFGASVTNVFVSDETNEKTVHIAVSTPSDAAVVTIRSSFGEPVKQLLARCAAELLLLLSDRLLDDEAEQEPEQPADAQDETAPAPRRSGVGVLGAVICALCLAAAAGAAFIMTRLAVSGKLLPRPVIAPTTTYEFVLIDP
ncbi:MAG: hypothetical protein K6C36_00700 [Clostridia bacterium]|nr:hypothetical protein [Clostridia bacterium]